MKPYWLCTQVTAARRESGYTQVLSAFNRQLVLPRQTRQLVRFSSGCLWCLTCGGRHLKKKKSLRFGGTESPVVTLFMYLLVAFGDKALVGSVLARTSLCSLDQPQIHYIAEDGLELLVLRPPAPECWLTASCEFFCLFVCFIHCSLASFCLSQECEMLQNELRNAFLRWGEWP